MLAPRLAVVALALLALPTSADVLFVDDSAGGADDGSSWADAYTSLRRAIGNAGLGDELWVAVGTYRPDQAPFATLGDPAETVLLPGGISLYGGFDGTEVSLADRAGLFEQTVISGDILGDDQPGFVGVSDNSYQVVTWSGPSATDRLDGFLITGGNATAPNGPQVGAGLSIFSGSPVVANCTFRANQAGIEGAGVRLEGAGSTTFLDCTFEDNYISRPFSFTGGAGLFTILDASFTAERCTFRNNACAPNAVAAGPSGGGLRHDSIAPAALIDCIFEGNTATNGAGVNAGGPLTVTSCSFEANIAQSEGGAILAGMLDVADSTFTNNQARFRGGAIRHAQGSIRSSSFCSNAIFDVSTVPGVGGGAVYARGPSDIVACDFFGNASMVDGGALYADVFEVRVAGCTFVDNSSEMSGGAIWASRLRCVNSRLLGNVAAGDGGGIHAPEPQLLLLVAGCEIAGNQAGGSGGAIHSGVRDLDLVASTVHGNSATSGNGVFARKTTTDATELRISSSALWNNAGASEADQLLVSSTDPVDAVTVDDSLVQGWTGSFSGSNTSAQDPSFVDPLGPDGVVGTEDDDLRVQKLSPAHDAGDASRLPVDELDLDDDGDVAEPLPLDLGAFARVLDSDGDGTAQLDIGAREFATLQRDDGVISAVLGGATTFAVEAGLPNAGFVYWIFGSITGTEPGIDFGGGVVLPLEPDVYFNLTLSKPFAAIFSGSFLGFLDPDGSASATLALPAGLAAGLAGLEMHHAYLTASVFGGADFASNVVTLTLAP